MNKYKNEPNGLNWSYNKRSQRENKYIDALARRYTFNNHKPSTATFCISLNNSCNLGCTYCFNHLKTNKKLSFEDTKIFLDKCFKLFPNKDKYYIDLSGKGEPLLCLDLILKIKEYCDQKQDELNREVIVQFVSNGTLLIPETVSCLQNHRIMFGISLDGNKEIHDKNRKTVTGEGTYQTILENINKIERKEFIGCAVSLSKNVFPLVESLKELSQVFNTVSYKPLRTCDEAINEETIELWCEEYNKLTKFLLDECISNNLSYIKTLLNGDDYFGKFIKICFSDKYIPIRCDGGVAKLSLDTSGKIYSCAAACGYDELCFGNLSNIEDLDTKLSNIIFYEQLDKEDPCKTCDVRYTCGGECFVEKLLSKGVNPIMCKYKKHLIYLAMWFIDTLKEHNMEAYEDLKLFCSECSNRKKLDKDLLHFIETHKQEYSFTKGKQAYEDKLKELKGPVLEKINLKADRWGNVKEEIRKKALEDLIKLKDE